MANPFVSDEFQEEVRQLLAFLNDYNIDHNFANPFISLEEEDIDSDDIIDEETQVTPWLPDSQYYEADYTLGELMDIVYEATRCREIDEYKFIGKRLALFHIDFDFPDADIPELIEEIDGEEYTLNIVDGLTSYGMKLVIDGVHNQEFPPVEYHDTFVEISSVNEIDKSVLPSLLESYKFELKSTLDINIKQTPRLSYEIEEDFEIETDPVRLRPLLHGKGINELLKLYNSSLTTDNAEILILTYTKVIEYVSQTVIQQDLINTATKKLFSPKALNPDANYILELSKVFEGSRNNQKDYQAIKLTVETCCDLLEVVDKAPSFLKETKKLHQESKEKEINTAFKEVADTISQTRNMLSHAKTNYEKKGNECPEGQIDDFAKYLDVLAQQTIRWFARENEDNRVV